MISKGVRAQMAHLERLSARPGTPRVVLKPVPKKKKPFGKMSRNVLTGLQRAQTSSDPRARAYAASRLKARGAKDLGQNPNFGKPLGRMYKTDAKALVAVRKQPVSKSDPFGISKIGRNEVNALKRVMANPKAHRGDHVAYAGGRLKAYETGRRPDTAGDFKARRANPTDRERGLRATDTRYDMRDAKYTAREAAGGYAAYRPRAGRRGSAAERVLTRQSQRAERRLSEFRRNGTVSKSGTTTGLLAVGGAAAVKAMRDQKKYRQAAGLKTNKLGFLVKPKQNVRKSLKPHQLDAMARETLKHSPMRGKKAAFAQNRAEAHVAGREAAQHPGLRDGLIRYARGRRGESRKTLGLDGWKLTASGNKVGFRGSASDRVKSIQADRSKITPIQVRKPPPKKRKNPDQGELF